MTTLKLNKNNKLGNKYARQLTSLIQQGRTGEVLLFLKQCQYQADLEGKRIASERVTKARIASLQQSAIDGDKVRQASLDSINNGNGYLENVTIPTTNTDWNKPIAFKPYDTVKKQMAKVAQLGMVLPVMNRNDADKVKWFIDAITSAAVQGENHRPANLYHQHSKKHGWNKIDRITGLLRAIQRFSKLNSGVLTDSSIKQSLIDLAYIAYAKLAVLGLDNSSYQQSKIPCEANGNGTLYTMVDDWKNPDGKIDLSKLPESKYKPETQWQLLELSEMLQGKPPTMKMATPIKPAYTLSEFIGPKLPKAIEPEWHGLDYLQSDEWLQVEQYRHTGRAIQLDDEARSDNYINTEMPLAPVYEGLLLEQEKRGMFKHRIYTKMEIRDIKKSGFKR